MGHLRRVCRGDKKTGGKIDKKHHQGGQVRTVQQGLEDSIENPSVLKQIITSTSTPIRVEVVLDCRPLSMELDTGSAVLLVSEKTYRTLFPSTPCLESMASLRTYSGEPLRVVGQREVEVKVDGQKAKLPLLVVAGQACSVVTDCKHFAWTGRSSAK